MLKCVLQVWVPSHLSPSTKRRESLPCRASSMWPSSHALQQEQSWWVKSWEMIQRLWGVILGPTPAHFAWRYCQCWDSTCRLLTEYLTTYSSCYFNLCSCYSCFTSPCRIVMPYRTFFCYANSTQEGDEWIKILQWKLVSVPCVQLSHIIKTLLYDSLPEGVTGF